MYHDLNDTFVFPKHLNSTSAHNHSMWGFRVKNRRQITYLPRWNIFPSHCGYVTKTRMFLGFYFCKITWICSSDFLSISFILIPCKCGYLLISSGYMGFGILRSTSVSSLFNSVLKLNSPLKFCTFKS